MDGFLVNVANFIVIISISLCLFRSSFGQDDQYQIGAGIADVTGPAADVNMMGYASPVQITGGIHLRLFSRAFIFCQDKCTVFVSVDFSMGSQLVNDKVFKKLNDVGLGQYNASNTVISGTHTHSGPGGYHQYLLFTLTSLGNVNANTDILVEGIVESIQNAHNNLDVGTLMINQGELLDSNINRSPAAYMNNDEDERQKYAYDVDKEMFLMKLMGRNYSDVASINWFAVHPVSMNSSNRLISGDNKGYAAYLMEKEFNPDALPGKGEFVAGFASSNLGDVSPNIKGAFCIDTDEPCDLLTSTCNGKVQLCKASGPGEDMFENTEIIGRRQFDKAMELHSTANISVSGPVDFIHQFVDMSNYTIPLENNLTVKTCKPAMGYSFLAGTTDGPGALSFKQGDTEGSFFWDLVRNAIKKPSPEEIACHAPKPIVLPTGEMSNPWKWQPTIVDVQLLRIGQVFIAAVPGEFSTMAGRRLRDAIKQTLVGNGVRDDCKVTIAGLSNAYADYIVTYEEYQVQRYEGASTIYGPYTLQAYIHKFKELAQKLALGTSPGEDVGTPPATTNYTGFLPDPIADLGNDYGKVIVQPDPKYRRGSTVQAVFGCGNPRHSTSQMRGQSYMYVEKKMRKGGYKEVYSDADWSTKFEWQRKRFSTIPPGSYGEATLSWDIPLDIELGTYRLRHYGYYNTLVGRLKSYNIATEEFEVVSETYRRS